MKEIRLGVLLGPSQRRDAVHCALIPAESTESIAAGQRLALVATNGTWIDVRPAVADEAIIGVADPFLSASVRAGKRFWAMLTPGTATGLRHEYTHPLIDAKFVIPVAKHMPSPAEARRRLNRFAEDELEITYDQLMAGAKDFLDNDEYMLHPDDYGRFEGQGVYAGFWDDYEAVTGQRAPEDKRHGFFTCSC